jgi:S1-C subfamily serine protease
MNRNADIAILKLDCNGVAYLEPDLSSDVAEGQTVLVIGNPEISAKGQPFSYDLADS